MINQLRVAATVEFEQNPALQLLRCTMLPKDLRWDVTYYPPHAKEAVTKRLTADMLTSFQYGKWRIHDFNEATRTNKDAAAIVDKIRRYEAYDATKGHQKQHGIKSFRVLFTTEDYETRDKLRTVAVDSPLKHRLYFGCIQDIDPWNHETVLKNMWVTGASTEPRSLLPDI